MNKKITLGIIIDTALKIPPNTGVTFRLYFLSKKISELGINVKIFICNRTIKGDRDVVNLFEKSDIEYHIIPESIFYSIENFYKLLSKQAIDIIQFEDSISVLRYLDIINKLKLPVLLEMHDVESTLKEFLGFCSKNVNSAGLITKISCQVADKIVFMTSGDRRECIRMGIEKSKTHIVPNPIDLKFFPFFGPQRKSLRIIFVGNMFYRPNKNAAKVIIEKIAPEVFKTYNTARFYFVGMVPDKFKSKMKDERFIFTGPVDDLNGLLKKATIALCPVLEGSGMKVKILNYGAAGIPTIATKIGASGYERVRSLLIEEDLRKYPNLIMKIFSDKNKLLVIGKKIRKEIENEYEINKLAAKMKSIYDGLIGNFVFKKRSIVIISLPRLLWLQEKRNSPIKNKKYYVIKNGEVTYKENF